MLMKSRWWSGLALFAWSVSTVHAIVVVAPNNLANTEGGASTLDPFGFGPSDHYQQVFLASQFSALTQAWHITQIAFRFDGSINGGNATFSNSVLNLSTTSASPDGLSSNFASNLGPDFLNVFMGTITATGASGTGTPKPFTIIVNLQTPFLYDPAKGNLLMEILLQNGSNFSFDAQNVTGDSISSVFAHSVSATTGTTSTAGLVTRFAIVPEPAVLPMMGFAVVILLLQRMVARSRKLPSAFATPDEPRQT